MQIVNEQPSTKKAGGPPDLALREQSHPQECWQISKRSNPKTRNRGEHAHSFCKGKVQSVRCSAARCLVYCTLCSRATSFCARLSSDSDQSKRALVPLFFSTFFENSTSFATLSRIFARVCSLRAVSGCRKKESRPKSTSM